MNADQQRGPGQRAGLDRAAVLAAAHAQLAERGVAGLTMRGVAGRLGVAPNALYSHVADKVELVDLVLDDVLARVPVPGPDAVAVAPADALRRMFKESFDVLVDRADLMPHYLARQGARGERATALGVVSHDALARCGLAPGDARDALRVLIVTTIGFAAFATEDGPIPVAEVRANHARAVDWLLDGITGAPGGADPADPLDPVD